MKFNEAIGQPVAGTVQPSSVDWVNSKASEAKKGFIHMLNPDAPGQRPPGVKVKKTKKVHK